MPMETTIRGISIEHYLLDYYLPKNDFYVT